MAFVTIEVPPQPCRPSSDDLSGREKVRFLATSKNYPGPRTRVEVVETHMSWVFLVGDRVYKLKKPVRLPHLDLAGLAAREANGREEVRLNRRLATRTYLGLVPLRQDGRGLRLGGGSGRIVDWLVLMRRLPKERMLDALLKRGQVGEDDVAALAAVLGAFYAAMPPADVDPRAYADRFLHQQSAAREILTGHRFGADAAWVGSVLDRLDRALADGRGLLEERARAGRVRDGHGDLRPEHVCMTDPIVIFDCLEFSRELRLVDPVDEVAFLGMECALLGARWFGPRLADRLAAALGDPPAPDLLALYGAFRAGLRARLSIAHLLDPHPRHPERWEPLARSYLALADETLASRA
jgi:uncharacterized protein